MAAGGLTLAFVNFYVIGPVVTEAMKNATVIFSVFGQTELFMIFSVNG